MRLYSDKVEVGRDGRRVAPGQSASPMPAALVARYKVAPEAVVDLQRQVGNAAVVQLLHDDDAAQTSSPVLGVIGRGGGQPLDAPLRAGMEQALGADLSSVRVHTDGSAAASAQTVQAHAYTVGDEIVFGPGQYEPGSSSGQRTLAHELTHVVQQRSGPVAGTPTGDGIALSDPADSFERAAEANADRIMSRAPSNTPSTASGAGSSVQRQEAPEEEDESAQAMRVQRDEAPGEEQEQPM
jgi:Domain of unknown function (DUF4157)